MNTDPAPAQVSLLIDLESIINPIDVNKQFLRPQPLHVELGAGDGSFIVKFAAQHPELNLLGVERLLGRLRKIDRKGQRAGLGNLRGLRIEASYFLEYLLPKKSVAALHVYFPDPWPKRKHHKNRLINEHFPELAKAVLVAGGEVFLRTDDADYFGQMTRVFEAAKFFVRMETPESLMNVITDFERNFTARGVKTLRSAWKLVS